MMPSPRLWFATFASLVFLIGALAGVVVDRAWLLPRPGANPPAIGPGRGMGPGGGAGMGLGRGGGPLMQGPERVIADLDNELNLTTEQETAIRKILDAWRPRVQALQNTARNEFVSAQEQLHAEIAKTLTPDQAKRFEDMSARVLQGPRGMGQGRGRGR
jgi:uncharacterized membrane protein